MRPKKPRFVDSVQLADNLYKDNKGRPGHYRYKQSDGSFSNFQAPTPLEANASAEAANLDRDAVDPENPAIRRSQIAYHVPHYIAYMERINPDLTPKPAWKIVQYSLHQFARDFDRLAQITRPSLQTWWDGLTYYQQKQRQAAFRRFFNWLSGEGLVPRLGFNPFTLSDDRPRLLLKLKPVKARPPLTEAGYLQVWKKAGELGYQALQVAMGLSLYTALREGDLCRLQWSENLVDGELRVVVSKSEAQKGSARASRLAWNLADHSFLKQRIDQARELSLINGRCPYILSHRPARRVWNQNKNHLSQVMPDRLSRMFAEARDAAGLSGVAFHEIRGLSATMYRAAGYSNLQIQALMAHEDIATTQGYQDASALPFESVIIGLDLK